MGAVVIGVSVGQGHHPSALAVVEAVEEIIRVDPEPCGCDPKSPDWRPLGYQADSRWRCQRCGTRAEHVAFAEHFFVRRLEELPGATYLELADRVREVWEGSQEHEPTSTLVYADLTGIGLPFLDLLLKRGPPESLALPVYTTHGDRREPTGVEDKGKDPYLTLGKGYLVSQLQRLLQAGQLHLPQGAESVGQELLAVVAEMPEEGHEARLRELFGTARAFVGSGADGAATLTLRDGEGRPRIVIEAPASGEAAIRILDEAGEPILRLPSD